MKNEALTEVLRAFNEYRQGQPKSNAMLDLSQILSGDTAGPAIDLPCSKKVNGVISSDCLTHILALTPHPKVGHPVFWKVEIVVKNEERGTIIASVDPIMLEATGLPKARLGAYLTRKIKDLSGYLPDIKLDVVVQEAEQQVLGCLTIAGQPNDHNCGGDQ